MDIFFHRTYRGKVQAAILDWAGTTVDFGCCAPVAAFMRAFEKHGVPISVAEARGPMGMGKRDHIRTILAAKPVAANWQKRLGRTPTATDVEQLHDDFEAFLSSSIVEYADLIPGTVEAIQGFRARGMRIGTTTGYTRALMQHVVPAAAARGYAPDCVVCVDDVAAGRPAPWMALRAMTELGVYPAASVVKIGDTIPDIEEGRNADMWTVAVIESGNELGLTKAELDKLSPADRATRREAARARLATAAPHFIVNSIADCGPALDEINDLLIRGMYP